MSDPRPPGPYQLFMLALCVLVLIALGVDTLADLDPDTRTILLYADTAVCGIFFLDFVWNLWVAKNRGRYLVTWGWISLLQIIICLIRPCRMPGRS